MVKSSLASIALAAVFLLLFSAATAFLAPSQLNQPAAAPPVQQDRQTLEQYKAELEHRLNDLHNENTRLEIKEVIMAEQEEQLRKLVLEFQALTITNHADLINLEKSFPDPGQVRVMTQQYNDMRDLIKTSLSRIYNGVLGTIGALLLWGGKKILYDRQKINERHNKEEASRNEIKQAVEQVRHQTTNLTNLAEVAAFQKVSSENNSPKTRTSGGGN